MNRKPTNTERIFDFIFLCYIAFSYLYGYSIIEKRIEEPNTIKTICWLFSPIWVWFNLAMKLFEYFSNFIWS